MDHAASQSATSTIAQNAYKTYHTSLARRNATTRTKSSGEVFQSATVSSSCDDGPDTNSGVAHGLCCRCNTDEKVAVVFIVVNKIRIVAQDSRGGAKVIITVVLV
eukprot:TRINITY_DN4426_c0_g1_i3.p2 TRINITY_DN4426_c0_g1~~TRINITY_DN4426_c0_g1_i3.p2  ORF type:complete len:105 (-),score=15.65 TRINITY_DN4426_c0_g1_i3:42-356(-)